MRVAWAALLSICFERGVSAWSFDKAFEWARYGKEHFDYEDADHAWASAWAKAGKGKQRKLAKKMEAMEKENEGLKETNDKLKMKLSDTKVEYQAEKDKLVRDLKEAKRREKGLSFALQDKQDAAYARARDLRCGDNDCAARVEAEDKLAEERMRSASHLEQLKEAKELQAVCEEGTSELREMVAEATKRAAGMEDTVTNLAVDLKAATESEKEARRLQLDVDMQIDAFYALTDKWERMIAKVVDPELAQDRRQAASSGLGASIGRKGVRRDYLNEVFISFLAIVIVFLFSLCLFLWWTIVSNEANNQLTIEQRLARLELAKKQAMTPPASDAEEDETVSDAGKDDDDEPSTESECECPRKHKVSDASTAVPEDVNRPEEELDRVVRTRRAVSEAADSEEELDDKDSDSASSTGEAFEMIDLPSELQEDGQEETEDGDEASQDDGDDAAREQ